MLASKGQSRFSGYLLPGLAIAALLFDLAFNSFTYAALATHPDIGSAFRNSIKNDSPIVELYIAAGSALRGLPGLSSLGDATAAAAAKPLRERVKSYPQGADAIFFGDAQSSAHSQMLWSRRLMPLLLLLAVVTWMRRQKAVHLVKRRR